MRPAGTLFLLLVALAVPQAALGHAGHDEALEDTLVAGGERLMAGDYEAAQPGPLAVVPFVEGPLPCAAGAESGFRLPIGADAGVTVVANATHVEVAFDVPADGFVGAALDTATTAAARAAGGHHGQRG